MIQGPINQDFDAAFCLDVLEHIKPESENLFILNTVKSISRSGFAIFGMPSLESQAYASEASKAGHVNCKRRQDLRKTMQIYFENVFVYSMNDEVVHTGFYPMANYLIALCTNPRS